MITIMTKFVQFFFFFHWTLGVGQQPNQLLSEYGHATYQIKGNKMYNNMQANILPKTIFFGNRLICCISN